METIIAIILIAIVAISVYFYGRSKNKKEREQSIKKDWRPINAKCVNKNKNLK